MLFPQSGLTTPDPPTHPIPPSFPPSLLYPSTLLTPHPIPPSSLLPLPLSIDPLPPAPYLVIPSRPPPFYPSSVTPSCPPCLLLSSLYFRDPLLPPIPPIRTPSWCIEYEKLVSYNKEKSI
ncbi:hypothetical protein Pcinc_036021 [Petrolisthes cinctipes]|uniref:Uncharacterized protein n=1 Tax=Petrolisthes cinctipes TaxID=88211 RepID=A0AAE1BVD1_PETCI|nr:hypothetical protein Pcinc_036021 [Petrolisthes cinctipes]